MPNNSTTNKFESEMNIYNLLTPENINLIIEMEMRRLQLIYNIAEENYVEEMMELNPVIVEYRSAGNSFTPNENCADKIQGLQLQLEQQKRAKTKFRQKFVSNSLKETVQMLASVHEVIGKAEKHLIEKGYPQEALQKLRRVFQVDRYNANTSCNAEE